MKLKDLSCRWKEEAWSPARRLVSLSMPRPCFRMGGHAQLDRAIVLVYRQTEYAAGVLRYPIAPWLSCRQEKVGKDEECCLVH